MYGMGQQTHKPDMTTTSTEIGINDKHTSVTSELGPNESVASPQSTSGVVYSDVRRVEAPPSEVHEMHGML